MIAHSQSKSQVQAPEVKEKRASAFVRAFRKSAAVLIIPAVLAFSGTLSAEDTKNDTTDNKAKVELVKKYSNEAVEKLKKAEEAAKKEAEARAQLIEICKKMKAILEKKDKECAEKPCDQETLDKIKLYRGKYNEDCPQLLDKD